MQAREEANFLVNDNFSVDDLQQGLKLARDIRIPIIETKPSSDTELIYKYAELKILSQFLNGFDLSVFAKLQQAHTQTAH